MRRSCSTWTRRLQGGARTLTLRIPEIDAEGHLAAKERVLNVQVPKGILPGQTIRLAGQGASGGTEGKPGDLYLEVEFEPHPLYRVDGRDLYLDLPVAPWEAALGAAVKTPTPGGVVDLKIPARFARRHQAAAEGPRHPAASPGDFYVVLQIALPAAARRQGQGRLSRARGRATLQSAQRLWECEPP